MQSCDDCGLVFENMHDLQRHVKKWCPENEDRPLKKNRDIDEDEDQPRTNKWISLDHPDSVDDEGESHEHEVVDVMMDRARDRNEDNWNKKYEKYIDKGLTEDDATDKANEKMEHKNMSEFINNYGTLTKYIMQLNNGAHTCKSNGNSERIPSGRIR